MKTLAFAFVMVIGAACSSETSGPCVDGDADGVTDCDGDCNDSDPSSYPGAPEVCGDGVANTCSGEADATCQGKGTFVSREAGNDANPGTRELPVQTIAAAVANAQSIGGVHTIFLGAGAYPEKVTLVEGISIQGGYQCDATACTFARDIFLYESAIVAIDFDGVVAPAGVTAKTVVDGVAIVGLDGPAPAAGGAALTLDGGAPTVRANRIQGGNVMRSGAAAARSVGVAIRSTDGATLYGNSITAGASPDVSIGIALQGQGSETALVSIIGNTIRSGTAARSVAVAALNTVAGSLLQRNEIISGDSTAAASHGIEVSGALLVEGNRVNVDQTSVGRCATAASFCTGISSLSSSATITNNIIFAAKGPRTAAVHLAEVEVPAGGVVLNSNTLHGGGVGQGTPQARTESAALVVSIGACATCGFNGFAGRVRNNVLVGGINDTRFNLREDPASGRAMRPEALENNVFWTAPQSYGTDVLYRQVGPNGTTTDHTSIATINTLGTYPIAANMNMDPKYDATWHALDGSPCANAGTATEAPLLDFDGDSRSGPIDIGHDEAFL